MSVDSEENLVANYESGIIHWCDSIEYDKLVPEGKNSTTGHLYIFDRKDPMWEVFETLSELIRIHKELVVYESDGEYCVYEGNPREVEASILSAIRGK